MFIGIVICDGWWGCWFEFAALAGDANDELLKMVSDAKMVML